MGILGGITGLLGSGTVENERKRMDGTSFQPWTITTGTGGSGATFDDDENMSITGGLTGGMKDAFDQTLAQQKRAGGILGNMMGRNQGGFQAPKFQSQYQGLGGGQPQQNSSMFQSYGPGSMGGFGDYQSGADPLARFGGNTGEQPDPADRLYPTMGPAYGGGPVFTHGGNMPPPDPFREINGKAMPQPALLPLGGGGLGGIAGNARSNFTKMTDNLGAAGIGGDGGRLIAGGDMSYNDPNQWTKQAPVDPNYEMTNGKGPERPIQGGPPQMDSSFGYSEDSGQQQQPMQQQQQPMPQQQQPMQQQQQTNGPQGNNFTPEAFDINKATNDYFQQGMNVLNPQFQQQNANLAQSLQGSGRGGLQLASGSLGAGDGGLLNPDAYQTGNAQSNALANLYQQSRGSALGEQNQMYGQGLTTEQQRMAGLGQLYGQDAATAQQNYNQSLGAFGANQNQMLNYSDLNQSQMANLGMFSGMENDLTKLGLTAEQMRAAAAKGSYYTPDIRESSGSKLMGSIMGGIGSKIGAGIVMCFGKGTQFLMGDGSYKVVEDIQIGEDIHGGTVLKTHTAPSSSAFYDYNGTVVTYDHLVLEDGTWKYVEDANEAVRTEDRDVIYTLDTSNHRLYGINGSVFTDEAVFDDDHPLKDPDLPYDHSTWDEMLIVLNKEEA